MKQKRLVLIIVLLWSAAAICLGGAYFMAQRKERIRAPAITGMPITTVDSCSFKLTSNYRVDAARWNGKPIDSNTVIPPAKKRKKKTSRPHFVSGDTFEHAELLEGRFDSLMRTKDFVGILLDTPYMKTKDFVETFLDTPYTGTLDQIRRGKITIYGDTMKIIRNMIVMQDSLWDLHCSLRTAAAGIINATRYMKGTRAQIKRWRAAIAAYEDILDGKKTKQERR